MTKSEGKYTSTQINFSSKAKNYFGKLHTTLRHVTYVAAAMID
jgi:hypothetical protein